MKLPIDKIMMATSVGICSFAALLLQSTPASAKPFSGVDRFPGAGLGGAICAGPDPTAQEIKFQLIRKDSAFQGRVKITGVIRNVSSRNYVDSNTVTLYESNSPAINPELNTFRPLITRNFKSLPQGGVLEISHETDWRTSSEFPPFYAVGINSSSNDCNLKNNRLQRASEPVNALFTP
jgi:hypothetical protein